MRGFMKSRERDEERKKREKTSFSLSQLVRSSQQKKDLRARLGLALSLDFFTHPRAFCALCSRRKRAPFFLRNQKRKKQKAFPLVLFLTSQERKSTMASSSSPDGVREDEFIIPAVPSNDDFESDPEVGRRCALGRVPKSPRVREERKRKWLFLSIGDGVVRRRRRRRRRRRTGASSCACRSRISGTRIDLFCLPMLSVDM